MVVFVLVSKLCNLKSRTVGLKFKTNVLRFSTIKHLKEKEKKIKTVTSFNSQTENYKKKHNKKNKSVNKVNLNKKENITYIEKNVTKNIKSSGLELPQIPTYIHSLKIQNSNTVINETHKKNNESSPFGNENVLTKKSMNPDSSIFFSEGDKNLSKINLHPVKMIKLFYDKKSDSFYPILFHPLKKTILGMITINHEIQHFSDSKLWNLIPDSILYGLPQPNDQNTIERIELKNTESNILTQNSNVFSKLELESLNFKKEYSKSNSFYKVVGSRRKPNRKLITQFFKLIHKKKNTIN